MIQATETKTTANRLGSAILGVGLAASTALGLTACGDSDPGTNNPNTNNPPATATQDPTQTTQPTETQPTINGVVCELHGAAPSEYDAVVINDAQNLANKYELEIDSCDRVLFNDVKIYRYTIYFLRNGQPYYTRICMVDIETGKVVITQ
jgi:hypothetical protein